MRFDWVDVDGEKGAVGTDGRCIYLVTDEELGHSGHVFHELIPDLARKIANALLEAADEVDAMKEGE